MTIHASRNSVAGQIEGRPLNALRSIAATPMTVIGKQLEAYLKNKGAKTVAPEAHALEFYGLEHAAGVIRAKYGPHDQLPAAELSVLEEYNDASLQMAIRAYYYLLLICWRENRYCGSKTTTFPASGIGVGVPGPQMQAFLNLCSEKGAAECAKHWAQAGDITIGQLTKALIYSYRKGSWGSAYGGPKWAVVTECLDAFVWGNTSAAMMLDTVWTLAHNTAPIFNKGLLYEQQNASTLLEILDVQRAGMIPQYIRTASARGYRGASKINSATAKRFLKLGNILGGVFAGGDDVHWPTVKALGGLGDYSGYATKLGQKETEATKAAAAAHKKATSKPKTLKPGASPLSPNLGGQPTPPQPMSHAAAQATVVKLAPGVVVKLGRVKEAA